MNEELIRQCAMDGENKMEAIRLYHARLMTPRPISEAPTGNGSKPFLAYITGHGWAGAWKSKSGRFFSSCGKMRELRQPTHFLPMPPAPFQQEGASDPAPQQPITPEVQALVEAAKEALSVVGSVNRGHAYRASNKHGGNGYLQAPEWCDWALDEVAPKLRAALAPFQQGADSPASDPEDYCEGCGNGDKVPASGYWRCPKCDAEWPGEA